MMMMMTETGRSVAVTKTESKTSTRDKSLRLTVTFPSARSSKSDLLLDSGTSAHICPNCNWFKTRHSIFPREIELGDNPVVIAGAAGDMVLNIPYHTGWTLRLLIGDVLYVPKLGLNLISCSRLAASGISTNVHSKGCDLIDHNDHDDIIAKSSLIDDLYWIQGASPGLATDHLHASSHEIATVELWHNRLGHVGKDKISDMIRKNQLKDKIVANNDLCLDCSSGKQTRDPFNGHLDKAKVLVA
jgi:GAG-pre-integrase domain